MKKAIKLSEEETFYYIDCVFKLENENHELRKLLCIANSSNSILLENKHMNKEREVIKLKTETAEVQENFLCTYTKKRKNSE